MFADTAGVLFLINSEGEETAGRDLQYSDSVFLSLIQVFVSFAMLCLYAWCSCSMYNSLVRKDEELPESKRVMTDLTSCMFWLICCLTSVICVAVFYLFLNYEINSRLQLVRFERANQVPIAFADASVQPEPLPTLQVFEAKDDKNDNNDEEVPEAASGFKI